MMDSIDQRLIQALQKNGRESYADLAKTLGVVEGTVRKRIKRLIAQDIVKIVGVPNVNELGYGLMSIVGIQVRMEDLRTVAEKMARNQHVCYLAFVAGRYDLMTMVMTRSPQELSCLIEKELSIIPGVLKTETFVNLDIIKGERGLLDTIELVRNLSMLPLSKGTRKS